MSRNNDVTQVLLSCHDETFDNGIWELVLSVATPTALAITAEWRTQPKRLDDLARHLDPGVRSAAADNSHVSVETLDRLARTDPDHGVREQARFEQQLRTGPNSERLRLAAETHDWAEVATILFDEDTHLDVASAALMSHLTQMPEEVACQTVDTYLQFHDDPDIVAPKHPIGAWLRTTEHCHHLRDLISRHIMPPWWDAAGGPVMNQAVETHHLLIPPDNLADYATSTDPRHRAIAAGHPHTTAELLHELGDDDHPHVTKVLLGRTDLDADLLRILTNNPDCGYDIACLRNPTLARNDLRALLLHSATQGSILGCHYELETTTPSDERLKVMLSRHPGMLGPTILAHPNAGTATIDWAITAGPPRLGGQAAALAQTPDRLRLAYLRRSDVCAALVPNVVNRLHPAGYGQVPWHLGLNCPGPFRAWLGAKLAAQLDSSPSHIHLMMAARELHADVDDVLAGISDCHTAQRPVTTPVHSGRSGP